ncbi:MAG TPA: beta-N-acetylhexosaminidase [Polyangiaceae bacterium]|nr:beta-N-acetylhexosaminidase [Polyangiaceae bacterium]
MTSELERQAASLFTVGFYGKSITDDLTGLLARGVGGVIYFARNVGTPAEVLELNREIKATAARPLVLAIDQEGGQVARLRQGFTEIPPMRAVGATGSATLARELGKLIARELRAVGFDMNYAPVLDIDTNPQNPIIAARSFGRTPELVTELGLALAAGLQEAGVAACGKHFPGHGDTSQDSHLELPTLPHAMERLERVELAPFKAAAQAGIASFMTAHVIFEAVDSKYPATMSREVLTGILREKLGYDGMVVTDDVEMKAIADNYGVEEAVLLGLNAGVDHFLCCHTAALAHQAIEAVVKAVESGKLSQGVLDVATRRFGAVRSRYAKPVGGAEGLATLRAPEHLALIDKILSGVDTSLSEAGADPTEVMERIRVEREASRAAAK